MARRPWAPPTIAMILPLIAAAILLQNPVTLRVRVTDSATRLPVPCRVTVVDSAGRLATLDVKKSPHVAIRTGVVYSADGSADIRVIPGSYTLFATRGPRYSMATKRVSVKDRDVDVPLLIGQEVILPGYISVDTHIHTLQFSGHGDSSAEERMVTLAGEEIEMPISTEHNRQVDYGPFIASTGLSRWMTPVVGNEVTTPNGHFNIFPVRPDGTPPPWQSKDRSETLAAIRKVPGSPVVIFNHPFDTHSDIRPDSSERFHALSGENLDGQPWDADAVEVINSSAQQSDEMRPFRDWFALLNSGRNITAVGASDSHDVNAFMVGQARTYVKSTVVRPDQIDVSEVCRNLKAGRALVSCGLVTEMWVNGTFEPGDLVTVSGDSVRVRAKVQGPRWLSADRVELYGNGLLLAAKTLVPGIGSVVKADITFTLPKPNHDVWLVAMASGPGPDDVRAPYWPLARPYQPTQADWQPRVVGATNPIWIDSDGDSKYSSPKEVAARLIDESRGDIKSIITALERHDSAVAVQAAALCRQRGIDLSAGPGKQAVEAASPAVRQAIAAYFILLKREKD